MEMKSLVGLIVGITVSIIVFVSVLAPVIVDATAEGGPLDGQTTWITLVAVCGTLTVIAILMVVVRSLGSGKARSSNNVPSRRGTEASAASHYKINNGGSMTWKRS